MLFKDIVGRKDVKQKLVDMVAQNRLSHALLFLGKEGSGALPLALAFANYVSLNPNASSSSDGGLFGDAEDAKPTLPGTPDEADAFMKNHQGYSKTSQMVHPDIHYTYPVIPAKAGDKPLSTDYIAKWRSFVAEQPYGNVFDWLQHINAENKQGNISAHECNEIVRKLSLKSFESEYKILVLWAPEALGKEGNKLLKLIEEPPPDTLFILVAENEEQIISTILSRTQLVKIPLAEDEEIVQYLRQKADVVQAMQATAHSAGNVREALHFLAHNEDTWLDLLKTCFNAVLRLGAKASSQWVTQISELGREKQKQFLRYFLQMTEHGIRAHVLGLSAVAAPDAEKEFIGNLVKNIKPDALEAIAELLNSHIYHIERNANPKMLFHAFIIRISTIIQNNTVILVK
jgi:DNA polymerase III subunit delta'